MRLLTTDLDQTLIFSKRHLEAKKYICIEKKDGREISFITPTVEQQLKEIQGLVDFVPVTTRSKDQYERIILWQHLQPSYAILANGGIILKNGKVDNEWSDYIQTTLPALELKKVPLLFSPFLAKLPIKQYKIIDNLYYCYIVDFKTINPLDVQRLNDALYEYGWHCNLQHRKLYILPQAITKGRAVSYVKQQAPYQWHIAAGDSWLDYSMLELSDECYIPMHGELANKVNLENANIQKFGTDFTEYFLQQVLTIQNESSKSSMA